MKKLLFTLLVLCLVSGSFLRAQMTPKDKGYQAITMEAIRGQLEFLASDWMEGRNTGEKGFYLAADYAASMFKVFGAAGGGDAMGGGGFQGGARPQRTTPGPVSAPQHSYFQDFTLIENVTTGPSSLTIKKAGRAYEFEESVDFRTGNVSLGGEFEAPVVFVGYGLVDKANGLDDFAGVDVKGKIILRLAGFPGSNDTLSPMYKKLIGNNRRAAMQMSAKKSEAIANLGVAGIIDITLNANPGSRWGVSKFDNVMAPTERGGPRSPGMRLESKEVPSAPVTLTVTDRIINLLLKDTGIDLAKIEKDAAAGVIKFKPVVMPGVSATVKTTITSRRINTRNVIAMIVGENPNEFVAIGAHMDHLGIRNGSIWNGADDNASGTVGVMTIAKAFAASGVKPKRTILFCAWCGEEKGLLGSEYFTQHPTIGKISDYKFYMNFDMIARDAANDSLKNKKEILYTKAYPKLEEITRKNRDQYKVNLDISYRSTDAPTGGSDFSAFTANKIPVISWVSTINPDYHKVTDELSLINWNKMLEVIKLGYLQMWDIANGEIK
jgi:hypothetical protein